MGNGGQFGPDLPHTSGVAPERTVDLARKIALLAAIVISIVLATRLITYWLDSSTELPTVAAGFFTIVASSVALAGDGFKVARMSLRPVLVAISVSLVLAIIAILTFFLGNPTVSGKAVVASGNATTTESDPAPFVVGVDAYASGACGTYTFEQTARELDPIPSGGGGTTRLSEWLTEHDAVQSLPYGLYTVAHLILNITGQTDSPVTITGISFEAVKRQPTGPSGTVISGQCGDATAGRFIEVNLDTTPPGIVSTNTDPNAIWGSDPQELTPVKYPYTVKNGDSEPFYIVAHTNAYVEYQIRVDWIYQSQAGSTVINNRGRPFKVATPGPGAPPARTWNLGLNAVCFM
jgi:hypothetical protein